MQTGATTWEAGSLSPLASSSALQWLPWGPAAGRVASSLTVGSRTGNTLSWLASSPTADLRLPGRVGDELLTKEANHLLTTAGQLEKGYRLRWGPLPPKAQLPDPWKVSWFAKRVANVNSAVELPRLVQYATRKKGQTDWYPNAFAAGVDRLIPSLFADNHNYFGHSGSYRYANVDVHAQESESVPKTNISQIVTRDHFKVADGFLGAGFFLGFVGAGTSPMGIPSPLAVALGGTAGAAAPWFVADRIDVGRVLDPAWDLFTKTSGTVVDKVLDLFTSGQSLAAKPGTAAAKSIGSLIISSNPPVVGELTNAAWGNL